MRPREADLKPCPFCGGAAEEHEEMESGYPVSVTVRCQDCGATHPPVRGGSMQGMVRRVDTHSATRRWNNRSGS